MILFSVNQIEQWKSELISGEAPAIAFGRHDLAEHLGLLEREFSGHPRLCFETAALIVRIRRKLDLEEVLETFNYLMETELDFLCAKLDSRWLISVADTLADHGSAEERLGAMIPVVLTNTIKLAETERYFTADTSPDELRLRDVWGGQPPRPLWDGVSSYWVSCGDMPSSLFRRCRAALAEAPYSLRIFDTLISRLKNTPNVFSRLARYNPHFWEPYE